MAERKESGNASRSGSVIAWFREDSELHRIQALLIVIALIVVVFFCRLFYLQVIMAGEYSEEATASRTVDIELTPTRGTIYDRNGNVLATSVECTTIYCDPTEVDDVKATAKKIAGAIGGKAKDYTDALSAENTSFAYIKRQVDTDKAEALEEMDLDGIYFLEDSKRMYPNGSTGGQIIGLCDVDGNGLSGLELYYDDILGGEAGHLTYEQGGTGVTIAGTEERTDAVDGEDIIVSIDLDMQAYVEKAIAEGTDDLGGESGQVILMDGSTGEILAACSTPLLDPTDTDDMEDGATELKPVSQAFEPGSIFKAVTMLACLEEGVLTPDTEYYCPAELEADEYTISDAHERDDITYTATEIMQYSSNVGISLCAQDLGFETLYEYIGKYKLDEEYTGIDFPGEAAGYLSDVSEWSEVQGDNVSFGQGVSVTPLQMTRFYAALTNGGTAVTPHFLIEKPQSGEQPEWESETIIENKKALKQLNKMLTEVVEDGTGTKARIDGYDVAGKTGTAEYVAEGETDYEEGSYNLSFIGYLPESDSDLVCFVGVTEVPSDSTTTSIFQDIMSFAIDRYNVNP